MFNVELILS